MSHKAKRSQLGRKRERIAIARQLSSGEKWCLQKQRSHICYLIRASIQIYFNHKLFDDLRSLFFFSTIRVFTEHSNK